MQEEGLDPVDLCVAVWSEAEAELVRWGGTARADPALEIKGVTHHGVEVRTRDGSLESTLVLDV